MKRFRPIMAAVILPLLLSAVLAGCSGRDILDHTGNGYQSYKVKDSSGVTGLLLRFSTQQMGTPDDPERLLSDLSNRIGGSRDTLVAEPGFYTDTGSDTGSSGQDVASREHLDEMESMLGISLVRPKNMEEQAGKNNYSLIAGSSAVLLDMESGPLRWGEYFVMISAAMLTDPSASCSRMIYRLGNPLYSTQELLDGTTADVIRDHDTDMAYIIMIRDHVLELISINTSDENNVRLFVSELQ